MHRRFRIEDRQKGDVIYIVEFKDELKGRFRRIPIDSPIDMRLRRDMKPATNQRGIAP